MTKLLLPLLLMALSTSCTHDAGKIPDHVNGYSDEPFVQEYHEGFLIDTVNTDANDVRSICPDKENNIWIATKHGVYIKKHDSHAWKLMIEGAEQGPAYDIRQAENGNIWIATWNGVYKGNSRGVAQTEGPVPPVAKIVVSGEVVFALGPKGIWLRRGDLWEKQNFETARSIRAAVADGAGGLWIGTDVGLYHCTVDKSTVYRGKEHLISAYVRALDFDRDGNLWAGGLGGVAIRNKNQKIDEKLPGDGIPNAHVNVIKKAPGGKMWVGTAYGITRFIPGSRDYSVRLSKRWLMSDEVRDIAFDSKGNAWIATAAGVSAIKQRKMTLEQKADYFYTRLIQRHVREPWIVGRFRLEVPGDTTTLVPDDDDNDGEYTAMYLAMESLRYAVTKDKKAKERAKKAFDFLHFLREVTEMDGFFARTIIPAHWSRMHDPNKTYTPQELAEELIKNPRHKPVEVRWHLSKSGEWLWKGDTSSDELCGHLFGYYWYYTLVADDLEKQRMAHHFSQIMDHLLRHDFYLTGVDGKHTKWGVWSPQSLNHDPEWSPEKALNSLEILSFLKFAYQITGFERYQEAFLKLIREEGYLENANMLHHTDPAWKTYFDIYLALYIYPPLLNYEQDPDLKYAFRRHLDLWFEQYKKVKSPLVNFTYNYLTGGYDELDHSIFFLQDAPLDLVDWQIDNGRREDLRVVREPVLEVLQVHELRPPSEYRTMRWDRNPYVTVGGSPSQEREPVYWLLPYWMGRYLDLIKPAE